MFFFIIKSGVLTIVYFVEVSNAQIKVSPVVITANYKYLLNNVCFSCRVNKSY